MLVPEGSSRDDRIRPDAVSGADEEVVAKGETTSQRASTKLRA